MDTVESRINQIIKQHDLLMFHYQNILDQFEGKKIRDSLEFIMENPTHYFKNKNMGYLEKFHLIANCIVFFMHNETAKHYFKSIKPVLFRGRKLHTPEEVPDPTEGKFFTYIVKLLIKGHIRRQLKNLQGLYLREIIIHNPYLNNEKIDDLRRIISISNRYVKQTSRYKTLFCCNDRIIFGNSSNNADFRSRFCTIKYF